MNTLLTSVPKPPQSVAAPCDAPQVDAALALETSQVKQGLRFPEPPQTLRSTPDTTDTNGSHVHSWNGDSAFLISQSPLPLPPARFINA